MRHAAHAAHCLLMLLMTHLHMLLLLLGSQQAVAACTRASVPSAAASLTALSAAYLLVPRNAVTCLLQPATETLITWDK